MKYKYPDWPGWPGNRAAVIAEVGVNHGGDENLAWDMICSAHNNGADFVKLQSFVTEDFFHQSLPYFSETKSLELSFEAQKLLFNKAAKEGIQLITTPFDFQSVERIEELNPPAYKIASMDIDNIPLVRFIAEKKKAVLISTGMAQLGEIEKVVEVFSKAGNEKLILLHCVSDYPTKEEDTNVAMVPFLSETFSCSAGLSDHSLGITSALIAASLGAVAIEKHFTTDRSLEKDIPNADHDISLEPNELNELRTFCEKVSVMLGSAPRTLTEGEINGRNGSRRGLYAKKDINAGESLSIENLALLRPLLEIPVGSWDSVAGKTAVKKIFKNQPIRYSDFDL